MKRKTSKKEKVTLTDRIAVAFLSALLSFFTGLVIWFLIVAAFSFEGPYIFSSFKLVYIFTGIMALSGFFMLENFCATIIGRLWHGIFDYTK